jgi:biotin carboxylase
MSAPDGALPRLVVRFDPMVQTLKVIEASKGIWRTVWMIDRNEDGVSEWLRPLRRFGEVIDVTGLPLDAAVDAVAHYEPGGIIAFCDEGLPITAAIGTRLGLPAFSEASTERLTNKVIQREALRAAGLPVPAFHALPACASSERISRIARLVRYPAVVKPQCGAGSRDTYRVWHPDELLGVVRGQLQLDSDLIVEEELPDGWPRGQRLDSDIVSVESIVARGRLSHFAVTGRTAFAEPFLETGMFIPSTLPDDDVDAVLLTAGRAIEAMGTDSGAFHTEIKLTPDGPRVVEVNGRVGGHIAQLLESATGQSTYAIAGRVALGEDVVFDQLFECTKVGYTFSVVPDLDATRLTQLGGLADAYQVPGVRDIQVGRNVGDHLDWREGFAGTIFDLLGEADSHESMWKARQEVLDVIKVTFERRSEGLRAQRR